MSMALPEPKNGNLFTGAEKAEHERRGWIFQEFTALTDVQPMYALRGYEESVEFVKPPLSEFALQNHWHPANRRT